MTIKEFVKAFYPHAKIVQDKTGISAVAILAQAALESGWGKFAPGNMFFGVKDTDGINGNEQLITTSEFHSTMNVKYPVVISITPTVRNGRKLFKYKVKDYFRKYNTPADCFNDHAQFFFKNKRYAKALLVKYDPIKFIDEVAKAGYATAPDYAIILKSVANSIQKHI
ncbi:peptidoglycan hydrolase [Flavobacterium sp. F372]|uniref:Glucosaminidase domain-containing protein n=1 Tax=Flavobacterium bernardetii TaxID=2813823 RepID=A0ABR7J1B0_9FLAO|nr:glucosaminidase domain-containing protein [Flavobacterium bernardetii]MBC5835820.1 glucosaminidase domain-containing protein [Flavobacterium bernardetii]NHF69550.1 peptidoglycan hydrolase [Flavobacterium bernardetii]